MYRRPLVVVKVVKALDRLSISCFVPKIQLSLSCEVAPKVVFGPPICRGGDTPDFGHAFSKCTYFRACGQLLLRSVQRAWRLADENKKLKERRKKEGIPVKYKSADILCRVA